MSFETYLAELHRLREQVGRHGMDNLVVLRRAVSTNLLARDIAVDYESEGIELLPVLLLAYEQSGGRGRHGRSWSSPAGRGVYATLMLTFAEARTLQTLPLLVGSALCRALAPHLPRRCRLKWPNDLLVESAEAGEPRWRKVGGVLIETLIRPGEPSVACIGFGVNLSHGAAELPAGATSLQLEGGRASLAQLTWDLVGGLELELAHAGDAAYAIEVYRALSIHQPGERMSCKVGDAVVEGAFLGFDDNGLLRLDQDGSELRLPAAEVAAP